MPHITLEYSDTISEDIPKLLTDLHHDLAARETIDIHGIKSRAVPVQYTIVGDGKELDKMIHVTLKLLPGRDDELRREMAEGLRNVVQSKVHDERIAVTVEVVELDAASYQK